MEGRLLYSLWIWTPKSEPPTLWPEREQIKRKLSFRSVTVCRSSALLIKIQIRENIIYKM